jgi:hypothetical protein
MSPRDRGAGTKGVLAKEPMPLTPHKKVVSTAPLPPGVETVIISHKKKEDPTSQPTTLPAPPP